MARVLLNVARHPRARRQWPHVAGFQIGTPSTPIFVAGRLAEKHDMSFVPHTNKRGAEMAIGHRRYGARLVDPVDRRYPEIEHAIDGRAERDPHAVRANPYDAPLGISKNQAARE